MPRLSKRMKNEEFILLVALLSSYQALCTFALLPAMPQIASVFQVSNLNDIQLVIGLFLLGNMMGQLFFGPLSDAFGRKPLIASGLFLFLIGCLISLWATNYWLFLLGRILQGFGAAAPRTVSLSMVRDLYSGRSMARLMSISMSIFTLAPIIAPLLGQLAFNIFGFRGIIMGFIIFGSLGFLWVQFRQIESLSPARRCHFQARMYMTGIISVWEKPHGLIYSIALGMLFSAFVGLMSSVQQIFQDTFKVGDSFPYLFALMAFSVSLASFINSRIVIRFDIQKITETSMICLPMASLIYLLTCKFFNDPGLLGFIVWGSFCFFGLGMAFANINALAMERFGQIAGFGAAIVSFIPSSLAVLIGIPLARTYDGTQVPLVTGFTLLGTVALILVKLAGRYQKKTTR